MNNISKSLAPHTGKVFEAISRLECIKPYTLVGGTALSLQIEKRQSEDLDFMKWQQRRGEKCEVNWPAIKKELETVGEIREMIAAALEHSDHKLRTRGLLSMLTNGRMFVKEKGFEELCPYYDVSSTDIQEYIREQLLEAKVTQGEISITTEKAGSH